MRQLDERVTAVAGAGFVVTPFARADALSELLGFTDEGGVWVKDETGGPAGSHKARHLLSILLHLKAAELLGVGGREGRLAIASCGNAALAAATLAAADRRELEVFVPPWAHPSVVDALHRLRAEVTTCPRRDDDPPGDPCVHRWREAVAAGAVPFGVQGPENALSLDGGRTLGWEMGDASGGVPLDRVLRAGRRRRAGRVRGPSAGRARRPAAPAARRPGGGLRAAGPGLGAGVRARRRPGRGPLGRVHVAVGGRAPLDGRRDPRRRDLRLAGRARRGRASGGSVVVAPEAAIVEAHVLGPSATGIPASATGTAGLAGLLAIRAQVADDERVAVVFSGIER